MKTKFFLSIVIAILCVFQVKTQAQEYIAGDSIKLNERGIMGAGMFFLEKTGNKFYVLRSEGINFGTEVEPIIDYPILTVYNPDFSVFRTYELTFPEVAGVQLNHWAGGLQMVESVSDDTLKTFLIYKYSIYDSAYVAPITGEDWSVFASVIAEDGSILMAAPTNFHGFFPFKGQHGNMKIGLNSESVKTVYTYREDGTVSGYSTFPVYTGSVYDVATGNRDIAMPEESTFGGLTFYKGETYIVGGNQFWNMDNTPYQEEIDTLIPIYIGSTGEQICSKAGTCYLRDTLSYRYQIFTDKAGNVKFVQNDGRNATIFNDDFTLYKRISVADQMYRISYISQYDIVNDDKFEFVVEQQNAGFIILNEDQDTIAADPNLKIADGDRSKLILRQPNEKYGRFLATNVMDTTNTTYMYQRTGEMAVTTMLNKQYGTDTLHLIRQTPTGLGIVATQVPEQGKVVFKAVEGSYFVQSVGKQQHQTLKTINTYLPDVLLWEDAKKIDFTTDAIDTLMLNVQNIALNNPPEHKGVISGSIIEVVAQQIPMLGNKVLRKVSAPDTYHIFLKNLSNNSTTAATTSDAQGNYRFENIGAGTYSVLVDVPGIPMVEASIVELPTDDSTVDNVDYEITEDGVVPKIPSGFSLPEHNAIIIYPNPVSNYIYFANHADKAHITITDISGRMLLQRIVSNNQIQVNQLEQGIYIISIVHNNQTTITRFLKK